MNGNECFGRDIKRCISGLMLNSVGDYNETCVEGAVAKVVTLIVGYLMSSSDAAGSGCCQRQAMDKADPTVGPG